MSSNQVTSEASWMYSSPCPASLLKQVLSTVPLAQPWAGPTAQAQAAGASYCVRARDGPQETGGKPHRVGPI